MQSPTLPSASAPQPGLTYFLYDGETLLMEMDSLGNATAVNTWGPNGLVSRRTGSSSVWYLFDERGCTVQRTNHLGQVIDSYQIDAYGQVSPTAANDPYIGLGAQWGYYRDPETGFQLCTYRYYDPVEGRWLTQDPIGMAGGINLYGYVGGNPVGWADPLGLYAWVDIAAGWGDTLTLGGTKHVRKWLGNALGIGDANLVVDYESTPYRCGEILGTVNDALLGGAGGWKLGAKKAGREFSHFVPRRLLKAASQKLPRANALAGKSRLNGNYVTPAFHAATDPWRRLPGRNRTLPPGIRHVLRLPFPVTGGASGALVGEGHALLAGEE